MSDRRNSSSPEDTEKEIGADIRGILRGENVRNRERGDGEIEEGPQVFPGMEDSGIGHRTRRGGGYSQNGDPYGGAWDPGMTTNLRDAYAYDREMNGMHRGSGASGPEESPDVKDRKRKSARGPYLFISYAFVILFILLVVQMVYFNVYMNDDISNSPYNKRQNGASSTVIRGSIESADGQVLARTDVDSEGNETRVYPYSNEYAHVVGFDTHGRSGIESAANYELRTTHANLIDRIINDFRGEKSPGDTVVSTLDSRIQDAAYSALGDYNGAIIVMRPQTGEIVAMAARPDFDPNTIAEEWDAIVSDASNSQLVNRATQGLYAPGSTFKIVTSLAYYRAHHTISDFSYNCTGSFEVGSITVHCYGGTAHGEEDFTSAFAHSCNTAFSQIGLDVGASSLTTAAEDLLIGSTLPCDISASKSRWSLETSSGDAELVQTAFGQGKTLVTPYQMALITCAVANDGVLMDPYLIGSVKTSDGATVKTTSPSRYRTLLSSEEAGILQTLMRSVVTEGSASALSDRSYEVSGKTGSAEYTKSDGSTGTHSWFVGYTGGDDPDYVIAVLAEDGGAGSSTAVPMAGQVLDVCASIPEEETISEPVSSAQETEEGASASDDSSGGFLDSDWWRR